MPHTVTCSACGAPVTIQSRASVFAVCSYCQSTVVRQDIKLDNYGRVADVSIAWSPLQVGTEGQARGQQFRLLGRIWQGWEGGYWNEWYVQFDNGKPGWLAEAQGFYAICEPRELSPAQFPALSDLKPGLRLVLDGRQPYTVADVKRCVCVGAEGELPFPSPKGREIISVDCGRPSGGSVAGFGGLEYGINGPPEWRIPRAFVGEYLDFDALQFKHLRPLDDWTA